ncbi:MAG: hypothetical protein CVV42_13345 [Candidatus Riflebacteria bacterium HGW-Riflebacteria-2]|jgi:tetratricopeptide (TPR) repeat protein|nr:MAG: hypothetical protein CVV42_13345 [Candidatus Riflebacteria bacterium HGW-Riflebacteria-2]
MWQIILVITTIALACAPLPGHAQQEDDSFVSETLIRRFNLAAELGREGKSEESIKVLEEMFAPFEDKNEPVKYSKEFKAEVSFRIAYAYMDMKRYDEAKKVFEEKELTDLLPELSAERQHSYHFAYGNTLGELGKIDPMLEHMKKAVALAPEDGAKTDASTCWERMMAMLKKAQEWHKLEEICLKAFEFSGKGEKYYVLRFQAGEYAFFSYVGQKRYDKARTRGKAILKWYQDLSEDPETREWTSQKIAEWQQYLKELPE